MKSSQIKIFITISIIILVSGATTASTANEFDPGTGGSGKKYAIIVGISDYVNGGDLEYCDEDASDWYNFLHSRGYQCLVFGDNHQSNYPRYDGLATEFNIKIALLAVSMIAKAGDKVVLTTAGHGGRDYFTSGVSWLNMYDWDLEGNGRYYDTELASDIGRFKNGVNIFIFIDHCYSGGMGPELMGLANSQYIYCTTTCSDKGSGYDDETHQNGAWTYEFLERYLVGHPTWTMEYTFDRAAATYPYSGRDAPMEFDGASSYFYL